MVRAQRGEDRVASLSRPELVGCSPVRVKAIVQGTNTSIVGPERILVAKWIRSQPSHANTWIAMVVPWPNTRESFPGLEKEINHFLQIPLRTDSL